MLCRSVRGNEAIRQMEQPKSNGTRSPGARAGVLAQRGDAKNRPRRGKNFGPKLVPGGPDIAHPVKTGAYEHQVGSIYEWLIETLERTESMDVKAAHAARGELQTLILNLVKQLLRIALKSTRGDARRWA